MLVQSHQELLRLLLNNVHHFRVLLILDTLESNKLKHLSLVAITVSVVRDLFTIALQINAVFHRQLCLALQLRLKLLQSTQRVLLDLWLELTVVIVDYLCVLREGLNGILLTSTNFHQLAQLVREQ